MSDEAVRVSVFTPWVSRCLVPPPAPEGEGLADPLPPRSEPSQSSLIDEMIVRRKRKRNR